MSNTSNFSVAINSRTFSWITKKIKQSSIDVLRLPTNMYESGLCIIGAALSVNKKLSTLKLYVKS